MSVKNAIETVEKIKAILDTFSIEYTVSHWKERCIKIYCIKSIEGIDSSNLQVFFEELSTYSVRPKRFSPLGSFVMKKVLMAHAQVGFTNRYYQYFDAKWHNEIGNTNKYKILISSNISLVIQSELTNHNKEQFSFIINI